MKIHYYQKELIKKLTMNEKPLRFNQLLLEGLESEHMNYHLKVLNDLKLVEKENGKYKLTNKGKDYSNLLDDNIEKEEKQPKTSVILTIVRDNNGEQEQLLCKRLRHPYYGKVGRLTGKVRFGETIVDAARRELYEETGLTAEEISLSGIYRKIRKDDDTTVQDVFFYIMKVEKLKGNLISKSNFQENFWTNKQDCDKRDDLYDDFSFDLKDWDNKDVLFFEENIDKAKDF
jgi:ADP-ribose pyrophosphatase YjhB (NUDIX family)